MTESGLKPLRIVVASPGDVKQERDAVNRAVDELNRGMAGERNLRLEVSRWEHDAYPDVHPEGPQGLSNRVLRIGDSDIVIAIFGSRIGTPVPGFPSGTVSELRQALDARKKRRGLPHVMIYFRKDIEQSTLEGVVGELPKDVFMWPPSENGDDFEGLLRRHLTNLIRDRYRRRTRVRRRSDLLASYLETIAKEPLVQAALFAGEYQVEPAELLQIVLREVQFQYGDPVRAIRTRAPHLQLVDLERRLTATSEVRAIRVAILLGVAGVGKTTTCRLLCRRIAEKSSAVPVYVPLGDWDSRHDDFEGWLGRLIHVSDFDQLASAARRAHLRLAVFLDGWNEQEAENLRRVWAFAKRLAVAQDVAFVMTSRPIAALDWLWLEGDTHFFEIDRWTSEQLISYFERNGHSGLLASVPTEIRNFLRLPLLASLFLRRSSDADEPLPTLRGVADVFGYVLDKFLQGSKERPKANRVLGSSYPELDLSGRPRTYLHQLAYEMTRNKLVRSDASALEAVMNEEDRGQFRPFLAHLIHSGLLRCSTVAAVDPDMTLEEICALKIAFFHQTFQEFLTAQCFLASSPPEFPADISHDAFWREVPVYLIQGYGSPDVQRSFVRRFLEAELPDYLTSARLAHEVSDPGERVAAEREVAAEIVKDFRQASMYPYAIEAFSALGEVGRQALRACLADTALLARTFARYEAHLMEPKIAGEPDEEAWRPLGRAVYILGELGEFWLAEVLAEGLPELRSLHLLYHIGEALLTLTRRREFGPAELGTIRVASQALVRLGRSDPVTKAQACAVERACNGASHQRLMVAGELGLFLRDQCVEGEHFLAEFWRRAHGIEALAEVADRGEFQPVLERLFDTEDTARYDLHEIVGYRPVQSSIIKAVRRSCDLWKEPEAWRSFLERIFQSRRIDENGWACRHLEHLLLRWFGQSTDLEWIMRWQESRTLGGEHLRAVLSNVVWQTD